MITSEGKRTAIDIRIEYPHLTARDRYLSNATDWTENAQPYDKARDQLRSFVKPALQSDGSGFAFILDPYGIRDDLARMAGVRRIIDLGFAVQFFWPKAEVSSLKLLWEMIFETQREKIGFSSAEAVELSIHLTSWILRTRLNDARNRSAPVLRRYLEKSDTLFGKAFVEGARRFSGYFGESIDLCGQYDSSEWIHLLDKGGFRRMRRPKAEKTENADKVSLENVEDRFRAMESGSSVYRSEQIAYAGHVANALNDDAVLIVEAGTGTGKTRGYLVPVLEFIRKRRHAQVAVSTYTKNLQEQIFQREIPFIKERVPDYQDISVAVLKGKSSQICVEKLKHLYEDQMTGRVLITWLYFLNLVFLFRTTDADSFGEKIREYLDSSYLRTVFSEISSKTGCRPDHMYCPAQIMCAEAASASLVITNHHKIALLDQDPVLADLFKYYIIDEANHFEHAVRNTFGIEAGSGDLAGLLNYMAPAVSRIMSRAAGDTEIVLKDILTASETIRFETQKILGILKSVAQATPDGVVSELRPDHPVWRKNDLETHILTLSGALKEAAKKSESIVQASMIRMLKIRPNTAQRLRSCMEALDDAAHALQAVAECVCLDEYVVSYQVFGRHWILSAHYVDVSSLIDTHIVQKKNGIVYTGATLRHRGLFDDFCEITGVPPDRLNLKGGSSEEGRSFRAAAIASPFPKDAVEIMAHPDAVNGKFANKRAWLKSVVKLLPELIAANKGRTLVLFGSYEDMRIVLDRIADTVAHSPYPILVQQKGLSTVALCNEFRAVDESILFGVDTFWYGVDFVGDTLTQVIITRIPYPHFGDPIQKARRRTMSQEKYWRRYLYETDIKLKQGIGRLIRSDTDKGKVLVLDSRFRAFMNRF